MTSKAEGRRALRVAGAATLIGLVCYVICALAANILVGIRLTEQVDGRLRVEAVSVANADGARGRTNAVAGDRDTDDVPIYVWQISDGAIHPLVVGEPTLPDTVWNGAPRDVSIHGSNFRTASTRISNGWIVVAESLAPTSRLRSLLTFGELLFGTFLAILTFAAAYLIGSRALAPVATARRRQAEFAADASHELRTPLTVIEAEVDLALGTDRNVTEYRDTLLRVAGEGRRLRRIVDDLLWLARADSSDPADPHSRTNLTDAVVNAQDRFGTLAQQRDLTLEVIVPPTPVWIRAESTDIDRLIGVLVDNACKFSPQSGHVRLSVQSSGHRAALVIDDSGPGIAEADRQTIFDRFARAGSTAEGVGLGLAIAQSICAATGATCTIGTSSDGGARFTVLWRDVDAHSRHSSKTL